jgi:hypothetical protein
MSDPAIASRTVLVASDTEDLIARAVDACVKVRRFKIEFQKSGEQQLRAVRKAGRLLSRVQRSNGGRPLKNSSRGLTSYQTALTQAGTSRQTANVWRRVAKTPEEVFEQFNSNAKASGGDLRRSGTRMESDGATRGSRRSISV